jgi:Spy/CpxP family protein refolding chaperone
MNKTIPAIALAVMTAATAIAFAQPPGWGQGPGFGPGGGFGANCLRAQGPASGAWAGQDTSDDWASARVERMGVRLNLTAEQKEKLTTLFRERQAMRDAQRQAMRDSIAAILTPEQLALFDRMQGQRGMGRRGGGPGWGGPGW